MKTIDARGESCPIPVVRAKKALAAMDKGELEVRVDNETAVHNLEALGKTLGLSTESDMSKDEDYSVTFSKDGSEAQGACSCTEMEFVPSGDVIAVIPSEFMGVGDNELGAMLMKGFIFALTQLDEPPAKVLLYNTGVKLTCNGSQSLEDLRTLAEAGTEILSCGTCLNHFGLTDELAVGDATNMYVIVDTQASARQIIRP